MGFGSLLTGLSLTMANTSNELGSAHGKAADWNIVYNTAYKELTSGKHLTTAKKEGLLITMDEAAEALHRLGSQPNIL